MNKFSWLEAKTLEEAIEHTNATVSDALSKASDDSAVLKSGGIELLDFMKEGLIRPAVVVNIRNIPGLDSITYDKNEGIKIGANVTLSKMEEDEALKMHYPALREAVANAATPQLRNISTLGGNIAQRTRCWYFRSIDHPCFRKGGSTCFAQNGENQYHAIVNNGTCCSVHASSVATALLAFQATVEVTAAGGQKKSIPIEEFFCGAFYGYAEGKYIERWRDHHSGENTGPGEKHEEQVHQTG